MFADFKSQGSLTENILNIEEVVFFIFCVDGVLYHDHDRDYRLRRDPDRRGHHHDRDDQIFVYRLWKPKKVINSFSKIGF